MQNTLLNETLKSVIQDERVRAAIERLEAERRGARAGSPNDDGQSQDPYDYADRGFSIRPQQCDLIYLLCRGMRATRVVEFATSVGMSTLYFAASMRDNGGGRVIGSELVPAKVATATRNLSEAGLADYAEIREGDARQTLRDLGGPGRVGGGRVVLPGTGGGPRDGDPSRARGVFKIAPPNLRVGGYVINDTA